MLVWPLLIATSMADPPQIVGGGLAQVEDWPSVVALLNGDALACTGTLITSTIVLTAAHCSAADRVVLDSSNIDDPQQVVMIEEFNAYPSWSTTYDVAWVRLESAVLTPPAVLSLDCLTDQWLFDGADAQILGFGTLDPWADEETTLLHGAQVAVLDADCDQTGHGCMTSVAPGGELTAGGNGVDTCVGDSGGGLWIGPVEKPLLAGVTSRGRRPLTAPCGDGGIYVRTDAVAAWVEAEAGVELERPTCSDLPTNHAPEPHAPTLILPTLGTTHTTIQPNDADPLDAHTFAFVEIEPGLTVSVGDDGRVTVADTLGVVRSGSFTVQVTDDGVPERTAQAALNYTITPAAHSPGCTHLSPHLGGWPLLLGMLTQPWLRRRRSRR